MKEYKDKSIADLTKTLAEKRESLRLFRFGNAGSKSKNVKEAKGIRKDIARILTEITAQKKSAATVSAKTK
jgi:ribosomal protein L29